MLLHDALLQSECPICLQPLNFTVQPPPSRPASPLFGSNHASSPTTSSYASSTTHSPISLPQHASQPNEDGGFHITFAPGVYGSDAADPWHSSFEISGPSAVLDGRPLPSASPTDNVIESTKGGDGPPEPSETDESASGVAVLPCGHLLHYLCAMQLCEYAAHPSCPVCRTKLTSAADLMLFNPRTRAPPRLMAAAPSMSVRVDEERGQKSRPTGDRTRRRERGESELPMGQLLDSEGSISITVVADEDSLENEEMRMQLLGATAPTDIDGDEPILAVPLEDVRNARAPSALIKAPSSTDVALGSLHSAPSPGKLTSSEADTSALLPLVTHTTKAAASDRSPSEDDILIVGARQLPPSQAYAELLLRSTSTSAERTEILKTRVAHLEKSQQQLQSDCAELEHALASARRRRELLLNVPLNAPQRSEGADGLPAFERLRELRRLSVETRAAMMEATAQLAASTRDSAEVRRQIEKYNRKLSRLEAGVDEEDGEDGRRMRKEPHRTNSAGEGGSRSSNGGATSGGSGGQV